jgi:hypothetical protein
LKKRWRNVKASQNLTQMFKCRNLRFKNFMHRKLHSIACHTPAANTVLCTGQCGAGQKRGARACEVPAGSFWLCALACTQCIKYLLRLAILKHKTINMINIEELFEKRYGGKTPQQSFDHGESYISFELINFAKYCIEQAGINTVLCTVASEVEGKKRVRRKKFIKCAPINGYGCDCMDECKFHIY